MNTEYTYIDGKAIVRDEKGNQKTVEYYDNLEKVLDLENLIEVMEKVLEECETESEEYSKKNKRKYIPLANLIYFPTVTVSPQLFCGMAKLAGASQKDLDETILSVISTPYGDITVLMLIFSLMGVIMIPYVEFMELMSYTEYKNNFKEEAGVNNQIEFLREYLKKVKKSLENLREEKSKETDNGEFRTVKLNGEEAVRKNLNEFLNFYYDMGYNQDKYYRYLQKGKLDTKLSRYYDKKEIERAKEYLEEKGPTLVRKKKR